ncbi:MAG: hypothetical protein ACQETI_08220 [Halobacteriota archaeon]
MKDTEDGRLTRVRTGRYGETALVVAALVGLAATLVHWAGLLLGGALVGVVSATVPRALVNGVSFGLVVLGAFAGWLALNGALLTWTGSGDVFHLSVVTALALPALSAVSVRGLV